jgi:hypothetical protein
LTVKTVDLSGNQLGGVWTVIRLVSDGSVLKTGFTPVFAGNSGIEYKISVANYDGKIFRSWSDSSTSRRALSG